jgi:hypothetical protein
VREASFRESRDGVEVEGCLVGEVAARGLSELPGGDHDLTWARAVAPSLAAPTDPGASSERALVSPPRLWLGFIVATACTSARGPAEGSSVAAGGVRASVTVVHRHLENEQVNLYPIPKGYEPGIDAERALTLGLEQLSGRPRVTEARLYLGEFRVYGTPDSAIPAWVTTLI